MISLLILFFTTYHNLAWAQAGSDIEVEAIYDDFDKKEERENKKKDRKRKKKVENKDLESLSELVDLAPFEDVAIIQRRFMPKTSRFEFMGSLGNSLNNAFFNNWGLVGKAAWYINENHGVELMYYWLNSNAREVTDNLKDNLQIETRSLVVPENFMGIAYKWIPIYGKIAWFNNKIVPFDLFFNFGGGLSQTGLEETESTLHVSAGQVFFWSKSFGFRWDLALNSYEAKTIEKNSDNTLIESSSNQFDMFLSLGVSYFWPEATYR